MIFGEGESWWHEALRGGKDSMSDEKEQPASFKVVDRRGFSADGTRRSGEAEVAPPKVEPTPPPAARAPEPAKPAPEAMQDFETLVSYLSTTAMYQLALLPGPDGERVPPDPFSARRTIDLLEVLQKKTRGNLTVEENRLLEEVLYELRMSYLEVEKQLTMKPR
jgi:hypothetical protein